jgi:hypothetical protein
VLCTLDINYPDSDKDLELPFLIGKNDNYFDDDIDVDYYYYCHYYYYYEDDDIADLIFLLLALSTL